MSDQDISKILEFLKELEQDNTVPRNIKIKIAEVIQILSNDEDFSIRINKALDELDEVCNDGNLQAYTRTQIWNVVTMLEECC
jgi:uncharacterized protein (UPF0147 family)